MKIAEKAWAKKLRKKGLALNDFPVLAIAIWPESHKTVFEADR